MNLYRYFQTFALLLFALLSGPVTAQTQPSSANSSLDTATIEKLTGLKGKLDSAEQVFKVSAPRSDLKITVAGVKMSPPLGFTSWAAFKTAGNQVMVMGDLVLLEDQVNPVMSTALDNGIEVTALHNHFLWDSPKVMFMHINGIGDTDKLAAAVGKIFEAIKQTNGKAHAAHKPFSISKTSLDPKAIETIFHSPVEKNGEVYKVTLGRTTKMHDHEAGKAMGVNTWAAFAGSDQKTIVDGDFVMAETEVQGVLKALRGAGISITAIHNHMLGEQPRMIFLHYWGSGSVKDLAQAVKAAVDTQEPQG
ncbi:DUF1259 domain-containing protein [Candidatus Methylomicrobium oryzae]|uniref:DUF1259 domain-containing protein n=1 Tax=Candidatus Methylomicrobium oryzae TaxID=2802053 RepID=UPI0019236672|nr:DUF1259 domain-containing protein [Methylomicrobium sp. RS1]MBL1265824.1 DUF1259 domain-containing protein [Methylomicrobium sp. RS1]